MKTLIFALLMILLQAKPALAQDFNILQFGAASDTSKLSTTAFNKAITACYKAGGGRVVVPAGRYRSGTIVLKDNVELHLSAGAVLYASTDHADLPRQARTAYRSQKDPGGWYALLFAANATNIAITGSGLIDGNGARQKPRPGHYSISAEGKPTDLDGRPRNILFISCKNVRVDGITMRNAGIWNQHYLDCDDVQVNNINVYNHGNRNNDGIDIDGCRRFILSNSTIDSYDDAVVLKSTGAGPCEDVLVNNCILSSFRNALKCGTESTGGFKNIIFSNCIVKPSVNDETLPKNEFRTGISAIALEMVDGGTMDGVIVNNILIEGTQCPIYVRLGNRARKHVEDAPTPGIGFMRNIQISDITAYNVGNFSSSVTGIPGRKIENIRLSNISVTTLGLNGDAYTTDVEAVPELEASYPRPNDWGNLPAYGFFVRHVEDISLRNIYVRPLKTDGRIPVVAADVDHLSLAGLQAVKSKDGVELLQEDVVRYDSDKTYSLFK